jgi:hypothetical protein
VNLNVTLTGKARDAQLTALTREEGEEMARREEDDDLELDDELDEDEDLDQDRPPVNEPDDDEDDDDDEDEGGRFTQEQVNRFVSKEKRKTRRTIETELGMTIEQAKDALVKIASGQKPEVQAQLEQRQRELDQRAADLDLRVQQLSAREMLQEAGCKPERVKRGVRLIDIEPDWDEDDISEAIEDLKNEMPELFIQPKTEDDEPPATKRRSSTAPRVPRKKTPPREDAYSAGAKLAEKYASGVL